MTLMTIDATPQPRASSTATPLNLTALLAPIGSNTGVQFTNTGREVLYVEQGTAASEIVVAIGTTVEGEAVNSVTFAGVASDIQVIGPFDQAFNQSDGTVQVTFQTPANVAGVALVANSGTY